MIAGGALKLRDLNDESFRAYARAVLILGEAGRKEAARRRPQKQGFWKWLVTR